MPASTIKDVAKYAEVSIATVSRVINGDPNVKPANIKKVVNAIEACNFIPNFIARNLKKSRTNIIGFLVSDISNPYFTAMAKVIETHINQHGYNLMICSTDEDQAKEISYLRRLLSNQVDGIILNTTNLNDSFVAKISHAVPMVLIERQILDAEFVGDYVGSDNFGGLYSITQHLLKLGHRKIGIINGDLAVNTGAERKQGFIQAMLQANIQIDTTYPYQFVSAHFDYTGGIEGAKELMSMPHPPTAIITANNTLALGALSYLKSENIRIPDDVSFFSYGNIINEELLFIDLSHVTLNPHAQGERVAQFLTSRISSPGTPNRHAVFEGQLVCKNSISKVMR